MKKIIAVIVGALILPCAGQAATKSGSAAKMEVSGTLDINDVSPGSAADVACARNEDERTSDLCAQWKAADAARDAANWAIWALFIGTVVNVLTLVGVALGWHETKKSADIALKQLKLTQATTDTNARAWLAIRCVPKGKFIVADSAGFFIDIHCTNHGSSPALGVWADTHLGISNEKRQADVVLDDFCKRCHDNSQNGVAVMPGETLILSRFVSEKLDVLEEQTGKVGEGKDSTPFVYVCATYTSPHALGTLTTAVELLAYKTPDKPDQSILHFDTLPKSPKAWRNILPFLQQARSSIVT